MRGKGGSGSGDMAMQTSTKQSKINACKERILQLLNKWGPRRVFVCLIFASALAYLIYVLADGYHALLRFCFLGGYDLFMDFFNSIRDAAQGPAVYTERGVIYPPMANLIFLILSRFLPPRYLRTDFARRKAWMNYAQAVCLYFAFAMAAILILIFLCQKHLKGSERAKRWVSLALVLNVPFIVMLERGNILLYSVLAWMLFIFLYDSESKWQRELSLIALAFSFSLKLYPAIFGWQLIVDKRYKDAARCALYGVLMLILPSFFFGGPICLWWMVENVLSFSSTKSASWAAELFRNGYLANFLNNTMLILAALSFLVAPFFEKDRFRVVLIGVAVLFSTPALNAIYAWTFCLAPLCLLLNRKKLTAIEWLYFAGILTPMLFYPDLNYSNYKAVSGLAMYGIILVTTAELAVTVYRHFKEKKNGEATANI